MALNTQVVNLSLSGGVDTKTAQKLIPTGAFASLDNIVRQKTGQLSKRYGYKALGAGIIGGGTITSGARLTTFQNDLVLVNNTNLYSYSPPSNSWAPKGNVAGASVQSTPVVRNSFKQTLPDMATLNGVTVTVWEDSRNSGMSRISVTVDNTGTFLIADQPLATTAYYAKVVAVGSTGFVITYSNGAGFCCKTIAIGSPSVLSNETVLETAYANGRSNDLDTINGAAVFAYSYAFSIRIGYITTAGALGNGSNGFPAPISVSGDSSTALTITPDTSRSLLFVGYGGSDHANCIAVTTNLATVSSACQVDASGVSLNISNITIGIQTNGQLLVLCETYSRPSAFVGILQAAINYSAGTLTAASRSTAWQLYGLASKLFLVSGVLYYNIAIESTLQSTFFTIRSTDSSVIARMQAGLGGGFGRDYAGNRATGITRCTVDSSGNNVFPIQVKSKLTAEGTTVPSSFAGLNKQALTFTASLNSDTLGENLHIAGGLLLAYDGVSTYESGFNTFPEPISYTSTGTGQLVGSGTYRMVFLFEWVDGRGQIHRSNTSISPAGVTASTSGGITVQVPTLQLTSKTGTRANCRIVCYRTINGQTTVYYRDQDVQNDPTKAYLTIVVGAQTDGSVAAQEILYTVGGALGYDPPPAATIIHKHKNRLYLAGLEDPLTVSYTNYNLPGDGAQFSNGLVFRVDSLGGGVTALYTLDDKLIIFKETAIFTQVGDGPDSAGNQDDLTEPQLIAGDVGCNNPKSIVLIPNGLMFQSDKGIYLLDRALGVSYIGAPVEQYNSQTITSANTVSNNNEVRFTLASGTCLVYNYLYNTWSTFSNYAGTDATVFNSTYTFLTSGGIVNQETVGSYLDNGSLITSTVKTAWLQLGQVQGFQRIRNWALLGDLLAPCVCNVNVSYDYNPAYTETVAFNTTTGGSTGSVFQFRHKPRQQKSEAMQLTIQDSDSLSGGAGSGCYSLVSIALEIAAKTGINKLSTLKTV